MNVQRTGVVAALVIAAGIGGYLAVVPSGLHHAGSGAAVDAQHAMPAHVQAIDVLSVRDLQADASRHFVTGLEAMPPSLAGTEVDGELRADADGNLLVSNDVRRVFDYFLTLHGEETLPVIVARLHAYFAQQLPGVAAAQARQLLAAYVEYQQSLSGIDVTPVEDGQLDIAAVRERFAAEKALREKFLPRAAADTFFADDDAFNHYSLTRHELLQQKDLTPTERARRLSALEDALPPALQASVRGATQVVNLQVLTDAWRERGGTTAELRQIRENLLDAAAADRLEALDAERAAWDARMAVWREERARLLANRGLDETDRLAQIAQSRSQHFSAQELPRVEVLEQM